MVLVDQLKETTKVSGSCWVSWIHHLHGVWVFGLGYGLNKARRSALSEFIASVKNSAWLAGSLSSGRQRTSPLGSFTSRLGCQRLFVYPNPSAHSILLVGADELSKEAERFFKVLAMYAPPLPADRS